MVKEDYVSFEIAKLLKERGFDENTSMVYMSYGELRKLDRYDSIRNSNYNDITKNYFEYTAPTLQMAMKWLREVHKLFIDIFPCDKPNNFLFNIYKIHDTCIEVIDNEEIFHYNTYEEACEATIRYCLENLI